VGDSRLGFELWSTHHRELRTDFDCGSPALNGYLAQRARRDAETNMAAVHILFDHDENRIAGFITLSSDSVIATDVPEADRKNLTSYPKLPAILIGRMAVDHRYQGRGLSTVLMAHAFSLVRQSWTVLGTVLVTVDALDEALVPFYARFGFKRLPNHTLRMYLPAKDIPVPPASPRPSSQRSP